MRLIRLSTIIFVAILLVTGPYLFGRGAVQADEMNVVIQGEAVRIEDRLLREEGLDPLSATLSFSLVPPEAGLVTPEGQFVGYLPGEVTLNASDGGATVQIPIRILPRQIPKGDFETVFSGAPTQRFNSDLWAHGELLLTGSWQGRFPPADSRLRGDRLRIWDIGDPREPVLIEELVVDARTINDVKIRSDGMLAAISHEGSSDGLNGISLLNLSDPLEPRLLTRFTEELETGVHNLWIEDDFLYVVADGVGNGLRILDISNPASISIVARFVAETSFLHDVLVRDGLAFLSHWDAGLIILDVGNGLVGGTPEAPVEVSRLAELGGQTHNAWYWPEAGLVFVGERDHVTPGVMHVVDVRDIFSPKEIATFGVPGDTPHNFWLDENRGILYAAWYSAGLQAIDVSGELLGELEKQGRSIASVNYGTPDDCLSEAGTCTWAPQLHRGHVFITDMNTGVWVFRPDF